uniref:Benzoate-CoA ligase n=1 Tax=Candidatus Kentrum sp. TUN TaxID=2126343 RepID=A0A451A2I1_9GAMM|nr:MAG: benzoate-CoA ligase [Candidatus Kentron sp. TUN]VFK69703.1 MAG: benzoate-CoA ligase [Candidatus Kentron sp. TUN]
MSIIEISARLNAATVFIDTHLDEGRGDQHAILCGKRTVRYSELHENVNRFGNILQDRDIRIEERVAILLPDIPEFAFTFFGTMKIGAVAVPLNTLLGPGEYEYLLNDSRARLLVVHASLLEPILTIRENLKYLQHIIVCGGNSPDYPRLEDLLQNASSVLDPFDTKRDDVAFWLYSSGTTGFPKGVIHRHQDMVAAADRYAVQTLGLRESDISFSVAKLFFAYGLGNGLYFPLRVGGSSVLLPEKPMPDAVFAMIDKYQPTIFYSVPTSYAALLQTAEKEDRTGIGQVRMCVSAGEPLPKPLFDRWKERFGVEIIDGIGSTEALHIFISNRPGEARGGSTGRVVPGYDARIVDEYGGQLPPGQVGTLLIRGESITPGYWNKHEATRKTLLGEWCDTHDKFRADEEGNYYYMGRTDDAMKVNGQYV